MMSFPLLSGTHQITWLFVFFYLDVFEDPNHYNTICDSWDVSLNEFIIQSIDMASKAKKKKKGKNV